MQALRSAPHRALAVLVVIAVGVAMTFYMTRAEAVITNPFSSEFSTDANGAILMRGNANLTCPTATAGCTDALNGTGATADALNNNAYVMENLGANVGQGIFNSSSATVTLPANSTVLFAGLYWGADTKAGTSGVVAPTAADNNKVKLSIPGGGGAWTNVTATKMFTDPSLTAYQGYADVTSTVAGAGSGSYSVGNIQAGTGKDRYAGWSLVIAYQNASLPMRNLRVYDGFGVVSSASSSVNIPVDGFKTPLTGTVKTNIGAVVYEGDLGKTGDVLQLDSTSMSDSKNPVDNFFNSTVSEGGTLIGDRTPNNPNLLGLDVDQFDATGKLANGATSASLTLTTTNETFYPGVVTFATDLYAPDLTTTLTGTDKTGDPARLMPADEIEYSISVVNKGTDNSGGTVLTDAVPAGTTYVPGSLKIAGTAMTDAAADDTAEFVTDSAQGKTVFRIGTGATSTTGGTLATNATVVVTYRVKVKDTTPSGTTITNVAALSYSGASTGRTITGTSNVVNATVDKPVADLAATVTASTNTVQRDALPAAITYQLTVTNNGTDREPLPVAKLTLPTGVTVVTLPAGCTQSGQDITCALGALASGTAATVTINATVGSTAALSSPATATASGSGTDNTPGNNTATASLWVNTAPTAADDTAGTATGTAKTINVLGNDNDPDAGDTLVVTIPAQPAHGTAMANGDNTITYTPAAGWAGTDTFTYQLNDGHGGTATATVTVNVDNAPPVPADYQVATAANTAKTIAVLANVTDPNGDPLSVSAVTQPVSGGSVAITGATVTFTPNASFRGVATFKYTASDGRGGTASGNVEVTVANAGPVAQDDIATTPYHTDKVIDVLANDTDANNDPLTITSNSSPAHGTADLIGGKITYRPAVKFSGTDTFTYTISDGNGGTATGTVTVTVANAPPTVTDSTVTTPYGTPVSIDLTTTANDPNDDTITVIGTVNGAHGLVGVDADGNPEYTPDAGWSGPDSFSYTIKDGHGGTATATVNVTVANGKPVAVDDPVTAQANIPLVIPVKANDSDPNGDPLTVTVDVAPAHGTAVVNPDGTVTYTPASPGFRGTDTFHYTVSDGTDSAGATVTVTVVNSAPVAQADAVSTATDTPVTVTVLGNDTDPNGDAIAVKGFTNGAHGTVTLTGGNLVYAPNTGFAGTDTFTYTIEDPEHQTANAVVTVTVLNANPIAVPDTALGQPGVPQILKVLDNDTDPNLGQSLRVISVTQPAHGTAVLNANGTVTYTADAGSSGMDTFDYTVTDDAGGTDTATVVISIDSAPVATPDTAAAGAGTPVDIDVLANDTDAENEALTLVSVSQPKHGTVKIVDGKVRYTPDAGYAGTDTFTYVVRDAAGGQSTGQISVTVANAAPVAVTDQAAVLRNGKVDIDVLANDTDVNADQKLTVTSVGNPAHGTATVTADGKIRYVPETGFIGTDRFDYVISDGNGGTATGTVSVTVTGGSAVALPDSRSTPYQHAVSVKVLDNDLNPYDATLLIVGVTQPASGTVTFTGTEVRYEPPAGFSGTVSFTYTISDGTDRSTSTVTIKVGAPPAVPDKSVTAKPATPVTVTLPKVDKNNNAVTVVKVGKPAHGTAKLNADGTVTYTPEAGFAGADSFSYSAVDEDGNMAYGTIKVKVDGPNSAPKAKDDTATVDAGKSVVIKVRANDSDANEDTLKVISVAKPKHGHAVINANGTITYAPDDSYQGGKDSFTYTVSDGHGGYAKATVTVTVKQVADATTGTVIKLPKTGADIMSVGGVGVLTLIVGAALFFFGGRTPSWLVLAGGRDRGPGRHRPGKHALRM
ncbi:hypothetical protein GCM10010435_21120 [Winogradskya consettensis]|uniref:DUF11 domain-containing protein n=1 Tax=Winogradskya consettensis TaxID=113560 RepID=A0A919S8F5_9ACTN|nr:Ig-like domain-containing protein [Actinoplanes consettensis]GIM66816.1 hypothetical protein Aco04nite_03590 [Actinoplanes consettensis]